TQAWASREAEDMMQRRAAQIAIDNQGPPTGTSDAACQVPGERRFSLSRAGAGNHQHAGRFDTFITQKHSADVIDRCDQQRVLVSVRWTGRLRLVSQLPMWHGWDGAHHSHAQMSYHFIRCIDLLGAKLPKRNAEDSESEGKQAYQRRFLHMTPDVRGLGDLC